MNSALGIGEIREVGGAWRCFLPVAEEGVERDNTFPYWFWAPFPVGGVTLKNLAEGGK